MDKLSELKMNHMALCRAKIILQVVDDHKVKEADLKPIWERFKLDRITTLEIPFQSSTRQLLIRNLS